jgi:hypothetical protein
MNFKEEILKWFVKKSTKPKAQCQSARNQETSRLKRDAFRMVMNEFCKDFQIDTFCDACASGGDITTCHYDVYDIITDGCGRPMSYCSKYKNGKTKNT